MNWNSHGGGTQKQTQYTGCELYTILYLQRGSGKNTRKHRGNVGAGGSGNSLWERLF